jgi:hypothetical protein
LTKQKSLPRATENEISSKTRQTFVPNSSSRVWEITASGEWKKRISSKILRERNVGLNVLNHKKIVQ